MDFNTFAMIGGAALFLFTVAVMIGWAWREKQHGDTVQACKDDVLFQRNSLIDMHNADIAIERNVIRELEISLLKAGEAIELLTVERDREIMMTKVCNPFRLALINSLDTFKLLNVSNMTASPEELIKLLTDHHEKLALDPAVNQKAKNLITRGVRKGAKMGREQMRKLMQKSIDNQAATIRQYDVELTNANVRRMSFTEAVANVLNDKIALPGVRRSLNQAIIQEHDRLRAVAQKKGE